MTVYRANAKFQKVLPKFKIFYDDGSTYSDIDGPIDRAQKQGVVIILVEDGDNKHTESDKDFYCYFPQGWVGVEQYGLYDYLQSPGFKLVLFGRAVDKITRERIFNHAKNDTHIVG